MKISVRLILFLCTTLITSCSFSLTKDVTPPPGSEQIITTSEPEPTAEQLFPIAPPDPINGRVIYLENCAPCHGATGQGDGERANQLPNPVPALASSEVAHPKNPAFWFGLVTNGNIDRSMPPFASLSDRQRWDVVAYSLSLSTSTDRIQQGATLYQTFCTNCHGNNGKGDGPIASTLAQAPANLADQAFMSDKSTTDLFRAITQGYSQSMPSFYLQLSEDERWVVAEYLRTFTFSTPPETFPADTPQPVATATTLAASSQGYGTVIGKVTNASDGLVPSDLEVSLFGYDEIEHVITETTRIKPDGTFAFNNIEMVEGRLFAASVKYKGLTFGSEVHVVPNNSRTLDLPIVIFETTTDSSVIKIDRLHLFFEMLNENTIRVVELYIMSNTSNKILISTDSTIPNVRFKLPIGSSNLEFQDGSLGERYLETPDGFGDTLPVQPGSGDYQVVFAFEMPYNRKLDFVQPVLLPVDAVVILIPEGDLHIKGEALKDDGTRDIQGTSYHLFDGGSLKSNNELRLSITGSYRSSSLISTREERTSTVVGVGFFGIALILAGVWLYRHTKVEEIDETEDELLSSKEPSPDNIEALMDAIIALDDLFQAGDLPEEAYRKRREELKEHLKELSAAQKSG